MQRGKSLREEKQMEMDKNPQKHPLSAENMKKQPLKAERPAF